MDDPQLPPNYAQERVQAVAKLTSMDLEQLHLLASDAIAAVLLHNRARAKEARAAMQDGLNCGCPGCLEDIPTLITMASSFQRDADRIATAGSLLADASGDFEPAEDEFIQAELQQMAGLYTRAERSCDPTVRKLNRLLEHGGEGEVG